MTKLSKRMQETFDKMTLRHREACNWNYAEWYANSEWVGRCGETPEQAFMRDEKKFGRETAEQIAKHCHETYNDARNGIIMGEWNTGTLKALEKRGYIEIVTVGGNHFQRLDKVRLLTI